MPKMIIDLNEEQSRKANIIKVAFDLPNKQAAVLKMINLIDLKGKKAKALDINNNILEMFE